MTTPAGKWNKKKWLQNGPRIGTYIQTVDSAVVEVLGAAGFEFLVLDCEHGPIGNESLKSLVIASEASETACFVRVPINDPQLIMTPLDLGAVGVQVPNVNSADQALQAVKSCRYHPLGSRGSNPFVRANGYGAGDFTEYMQSANEQTLMIVQVEGVQGVNNLPQILDIQGIDVVWLGPYDLSQSMGIPGQVEHPELLKKMEQIVAMCRENAVAVGTFANDDRLAKQWLAASVDLVAVSFDTRILYDGASGLVDRIRSAGDLDI
ncbi:MAG: aldolase/citrate lyase family protein [Desulfobacterales bacterium]|nr:aldolase/citrate lyase family protein [Desulfobacterales bacterium]